MKRNFIFGVIILVFSLSAVACAKNNNNKTIDALISHFKESGLTVGNRSMKQYAILGASDGIGLEVSGHEVEIYKYDINDSSQKKILDKIKTDETIAFMGFTIPVKINGSFLIINYQDNPNKDEILKAFMKF